MTDSRKLTDNELEQVAGGFTPGESFSAGNYVRKSGVILRTVFGSASEIVYRIDTLDGINATATMYEKNSDGSVTTTSNQTINLATMIKLDSKPDWVPAN